MLLNIFHKKKTSHMYMVVSVFFLLSSCYLDKNDNIRKIDRKFDFFPEQEIANPELMFHIGFEAVADLFVVGDTILFTHLHGSGIRNVINVFDIQKEKLIDQLLPYGKGPGEALGARTMWIIKDKIFVRDVTKRILFEMPIDIYKSPTKGSLIKESPFPKFYYDCVLLNDSILIGKNSNIENRKIKEGNLIETFNYRNNKVIGEYGPMLFDKNVPLQTVLNAHDGFITYNKQKNRLAIGYRFMDAFEIFDNEGGKKVGDNHGPEKFKLAFDVGLRESHSYMKMTKDTRVGFNRVVSTNEYVYMMYSGIEADDKSSYLGTAIYIFDWDGNPIKEINFDVLLQTIKISEDDSKIYVIDIDGNLLKLTSNL